MYELSTATIPTVQAIVDRIDDFPGWRLDRERRCGEQPDLVARTGGGRSGAHRGNDESLWLTRCIRASRASAWQAPRGVRCPTPYDWGVSSSRSTTNR